MSMTSYIAGADSEDDAFRLYVESKEVLSHGSFNLLKFFVELPSTTESDRCKRSHAFTKGLCKATYQSI